MSFRALKILTGLMLCVMLASAQQVLADNEAWSDLEALQEESGSKHAALEPKRTEPGEPAVQHGCNQPALQQEAVFQPGINSSCPAGVRQVIPIRGPPAGHCTSA